MHPTYTINDKNVITIHGFKHYVVLLFHKGAIIEDKYETLIQQTERVQAEDRYALKHWKKLKNVEMKFYIILMKPLKLKRMARKLK